MDIQEIRKCLLEAADFDLFTSPRFVESWVCKLGRLRQTDKQCSYDGITEDGIRVEIKFSNVCQRVGRQCFKWSKLQGSGRKGKDADVFVLVGRVSDLWTFLVLPSAIVERRDSLILSLERDGAACADWTAFMCDSVGLAASVRRAPELSLC